VCVLSLDNYKHLTVHTHGDVIETYEILSGKYDPAVLLPGLLFRSMAKSQTTEKLL